MQADQRRIVGRACDHHRAAAALGPEDALDEFLHFAAALADQADDDDVGAGVARHHAEQHRLADAGTGEQADALAAADGQQRIDRAHADIERRVDGMTRQRIDGLAQQLDAFVGLDGTETVERHAVAVDDAAEQARAHAHAAGALARHHARRGREAVHFAGGHEKQFVAGEADHFGLDPRAVAVQQVADVADGGLAAGRFQREADHARERAFHRRRRQLPRRAPPGAPCVRASRARAARADSRTPLTRRSPQSARAGALGAIVAQQARRCTAATVASKRASTLELSVVRRQPPRAMSGSSASCHSCSPEARARFSRTMAASSGCR